MTGLQDIAQEAEADAFRPAWRFEPFGLDLAEFLATEAFRGLIDGLRPAATCASNRTYMPFPLAADEPQGFLGVAPAFHSGLAVLLRPAEETNEIVSLWPFVTEGSQQDDVEIERVMLAPNRLEALIRGTLPSGLSLTWHDVFFAADRAFYGTGSVHSVILSGLVHEVSQVMNAPIEIAADNPAWSAVRAWTPEGFNPDGSLTIQTKGMAAILPGPPETPEFHAVRGPVRRLEANFKELFGQSVHLVTVAIMRDPDVELALYVTNHVLRGARLPAVGEDFGAAVRLVGHIWYPTVRRAPAEK
jgi:hypothetical protein